MFRRFFRFIGRIVKAAFRVVKNFFVQTLTNIEAMVLLSLATIGTAAVISELPFFMVMPMWIESTLVIPVLAVTIVSMITWIMCKRLSLCEE